MLKYFEESKEESNEGPLLIHEIAFSYELDKISFGSLEKYLKPGLCIYSSSVYPWYRIQFLTTFESRRSIY